MGSRTVARQRLATKHACRGSNRCYMGGTRRGVCWRLRRVETYRPLARKPITSSGERHGAPEPVRARLEIQLRLVTFCMSLAGFSLFYQFPYRTIECLCQFRKRLEGHVEAALFNSAEISPVHSHEIREPFLAVT